MPDIAILYKTAPNVPMVLTDAHVEQVRGHNTEGEVRVFETEDALVASGFDPEILVTWGQYTPSAFCARAKNLKWIHGISAGVEGLMKLDIAKPPLLISKTAGILGSTMAEHTLGFMIAFMRGMPQLSRNQTKHIWKKPANPEQDECFGKTVGIIGMGDIGREVAKKCKLFDMRVLGCRRNPAPMEYVDRMYSLEDVDELLAQSDFVVLLVPLTPASRHMVGAELFAKMKRTAYFINIGRGPVVDEAALVQALRDGVIAGAGLDALETEPLPADSPLWDMENVIITPHCSADSPLLFNRAFTKFCEYLTEYRAGRPVPTTVPYEPGK